MGSGCHTGVARAMPEPGQSLSEHRLPGGDTAEDEDHTDRLRRTELFVHEPHTKSGPHNGVDQPDKETDPAGSRPRPPPSTTSLPAAARG